MIQMNENVVVGDVDERPAKKFKGVRNLSPKASEADLLEVLSNFGAVSYIRVEPEKQMALVEFEDINCAIFCVNFARANHIYIAGQRALFSFSNCKIIQRMGLESEIPNEVLILTVYNAKHAITSDVICTICKAHGDVYRVALLQQNLLHALVEFDSIESAREAKHALNGADIYRHSCTLKVEFAKVLAFEFLQATCNFRPDFSLFWDSNDNGPACPGFPPVQLALPPRQFSSLPVQQNGFPPAQQNGFPPAVRMFSPLQRRKRAKLGSCDSEGAMSNDGERLSDGVGSVVMVYRIDQDRMTCDKLFNLMCLYGNVLRIKFLNKKPDTAMVQMGDAEQAERAIGNLNRSWIFDKQLALEPSKQPTLKLIRDPFNLPDGTPSFKDYSGSSNQRFTDVKTAHRNRISKPTKILHWYNAPADTTEERLKEIFVKKGCASPVKVFIFRSKNENRAAGVCQFDTVEQATNVLLECNHTAIDSPLRKTPYVLRLAFASGTHI